MLEKLFNSAATYASPSLMEAAFATIVLAPMNPVFRLFGL
jgi:hypothetical protein